MVNRVILTGNLDRDPEVLSTQPDQTVVTFSLATDPPWNDRNGDPQEHTVCHQIVCFDRLAEAAAQLLEKSCRVRVEGWRQTSFNQDRQTDEASYQTRIIAERLMLGAAAQSTEPQESPCNGG